MSNHDETLSQITCKVCVGYGNTYTDGDQNLYNQITRIAIKTRIGFSIDLSVVLNLVSGTMEIKTWCRQYISNPFTMVLQKVTVQVTTDW